MNIFKRKKKKEIPQELPLLVNYIEEARNLRWEDEEIIKKFLEKKYPDDLIEKAFEEADNKIPLKKIERRIKMKEQKEEEFDEEEDEEFDEEDSEVIDDEEPEEETKKETKKKEKKTTKKTKETETQETTETPKLTDEQKDELLQQIVAGIRSHEDRMTNIESSLFKLRNI